MLHALLLSALVLLGSAEQAAGPADAQCGDMMRERCDPERQQQVRELFGLPPIETYRDAGDQVRRAFYVDGYDADVVAIVFVRARGRDPMVSVHFPLKNGIRPEPLTALVPEDVWEDVLDRSAFFDRRLVPVEDSSGWTTICIHPWTFTVEAWDPKPSFGPQTPIRRMTGDSCLDPLTYAYAAELERTALSLLAPCRSLDTGLLGSGALALQACGALAGDRTAAARVRNRLEALERASSFDASGMPFFFERMGDADVDWNGRRTSSDAHDAWSRYYREFAVFSMEYDVIDGTSSTEVTVTGRLWRTPPDAVPGPEGEQPFEAARFEMTWVEPQRGVDFVIRSITVGPFVVTPR